MRLSLISALGPGLLFAFLLGLGPTIGLPVGRWYPSLVQVHAYVLLMGWGMGMILGVALHFLPRLRGSKLVWPSLVRPGFGMYAGGLLLRALGQPLLSIASSQPMGTILSAGIVLGVFLQAVGLAVLLLILVMTFRAGPPLKKRKGFMQILPALIVAMLALALAHGTWLSAFISQVLWGEPLSLLSPRLHRLGSELILLGGVFCVSMAMSARLFPLSFRIRQASAPGIRVAASLIGLGMILGLLQLEGASALGYAAGIFAGSFSIRVLHPRAPFKADKEPYLFRNDPSGTGVLTAYIWGVVAAILLGAYAWAGIVRGDAGSLEHARILALHAMGLGFMTLLIVSVGWAMLPGFAGQSPRGRKWIWSAIFLCNIAAAFRVVPGAISLFQPISSAVQAHALACAGIFAWLGIGAFTVALRKSFKRPGSEDIGRSFARS